MVVVVLYRLDTRRSARPCGGIRCGGDRIALRLLILVAFPSLLLEAKGDSRDVVDYASLLEVFRFLVLLVDRTVTSRSPSSYFGKGLLLG